MPEQVFLEQMAGHLIRRLHQRSTAVFAERTAEAVEALTSVQFAALQILSGNPGIDQARLAALIHYDRATIGDVVKRLVQKGLVIRSVNAQDRRSRELRLTDRGEGVLRQVAPLVAELQAEILGNLSEAERIEFIALARKALEI